MNTYCQDCKSVICDKHHICNTEREKRKRAGENGGPAPTGQYSRSMNW